MERENNLIQLIKNRRSIFPPSFSDQEIRKETLLELLECAHAAPTHKLTQPWRFTVFRKKGLTKLADQLAALYKASTPESAFLQKKYEATREKVLQSGAVITIALHSSGKVPEWEELAAVACAVENLWLAATSVGLGGYWSSPGFMAGLHGFLNLAENEKCIGLFYMGYHQEVLSGTQRRPLNEVINWVEE